MTAELTICPEDWRRAIDDLVRSSRASRSLHRPILVLYLLARAHRGESRTVSFVETEDAIGGILQTCAKAKKAELLLPFWHLQSSRFWSINGVSALPNHKGKGRPTRGTLIRLNVTGSVHAEWWSALIGDVVLIDTLVNTLLSKCFDGGEEEGVQRALKFR